MIINIYDHPLLSSLDLVYDHDSISLISIVRINDDGDESEVHYSLTYLDQFQMSVHSLQILGYTKKFCIS